MHFWEGVAFQPWPQHPGVTDLPDDDDGGWCRGLTAGDESAQAEITEWYTHVHIHVQPCVSLRSVHPICSFSPCLYTDTENVCDGELSRVGSYDLIPKVFRATLHSQ